MAAQNPQVDGAELIRLRDRIDRVFAKQRQNRCAVGGTTAAERIARLKRLAQAVEENRGRIHRAIQEGVPVRGYMYRSLTDNWEWTWGFEPRFGLIHVDYPTQERTVKESGWWYADLIRRNALEPS